MIRFRAGKSWLADEALVARLSARATSFDPAEVRDVLAVELEGVNITGGLDEGELLHTVRDLAAAARALEAGCKAAIALGTASLLVVPNEDDALLTLVDLTPPARIISRDAAVNADSFCAAARACAEEMIADLSAIDPALAQSTYARALTALLQGAPKQSPKPSRQTIDSPSAIGEWESAQFGSVRCGFRLDGDACLRSCESDEDLHALLDEGETWTVVGSRRISRCGPPYLALREWLFSLESALRRETRGFAAALRPADLPGAARAVIAATSDFLLRATRACPAQKKNLPLAELGKFALDFSARLSEIESGEVGGSIARAVAITRSTKQRPLANAGPIRRLTFRKTGSVSTGPILEDGLAIFSDHVLVATSRGCTGLKARAVAWRDDHRIATLALGETGFAIALDDTGATCGFDFAHGLRWRHSGHEDQLESRLLALPSGQIGVTIARRNVVALDAANGNVLWRFTAPGARAVQAISAGDLVAVIADTGTLYGLHALTGELAYRCALPGVPSGRPQIVGTALAVLVETQQGPRLFWRRTIDGAPISDHRCDADRGHLFAFHDTVVVTGSSTTLFARPGIEPRFVESAATLGAKFLATEQGICAIGPSGHVAAFTSTGDLLWSHAARDLPRSPTVTPILKRGILFVAGEHVVALDAKTGQVLGRLPKHADEATQIAVDEALRVFAANDEMVTVFELATHLSVVSD